MRGLGSAVEHEHFTTLTSQEKGRLEKLVGPGGECEGMILWTGAEGRADVSWGEHINYINNLPDIQIACHPNWGPPDGIDALVPERWCEDDSFKQVDFIEVFAGLITRQRHGLLFLSMFGAGWVRYTGHHVDWLAEQKWDDVLSLGCRVWALAEDDGALDFIGVTTCHQSGCYNMSMCFQVEDVQRIRPDVAAKGLPNTITESGLSYQMVFIDKDSTGLAPADTAQSSGIGYLGTLVILRRTQQTCISTGRRLFVGDSRGETVRRQFTSAMKAGRFYASTGVHITNITVCGMTVTVETADAEHMKASVDSGGICCSYSMSSDGWLHGRSPHQDSDR